MTLQSDVLRRTALVLVSVGLAWNLVEAVVALWAGASVGSVALIAFGLDSIIELFAGGVLLWQFKRERAGVEGEAAERRARRLIALTFFLLAAYVCLHSVASLVGWLPEPQPSLIGCRDCGGERRRDERPVRVQDARRHTDAVLVAEGGGRRESFLRSSGLGDTGGSGTQRPVLLVVGRPGGCADIDSPVHQGGHGES